MCYKYICRTFVQIQARLCFGRSNRHTHLGVIGPQLEPPCIALTTYILSVENVQVDFCVCIGVRRHIRRTIQMFVYYSFIFSGCQSLKSHCVAVAFLMRQHVGKLGVVADEFLELGLRHEAHGLGNHFATLE